MVRLIEFEKIINTLIHSVLKIPQNIALIPSSLEYTFPFLIYSIKRIREPCPFMFTYGFDIKFMSVIRKD